MESQDLSPPHVDASRPSLGFPLGTALLLIVIFALSGILSCCYHWDKLRSLRQSFSHSHPQMPSSPTKSKHSTDLRQNSLPVLMPGDEVPKFIAMPCPCQPSRPDNIVVTVESEKPPPKPPQLPVPFYLEKGSRFEALLPSCNSHSTKHRRVFVPGCHLPPLVVPMCVYSQSLFAQKNSAGEKQSG